MGISVAMPPPVGKVPLSLTLKRARHFYRKSSIGPYSFGKAYGVASCYNILPTFGGAYTLTELAKEAEREAYFMETLLPECLQCIADYMNARIQFIVEKCVSFESNFLVKERLIDKDRFLPMFGVTGLAECVNTLPAGMGKR